jgi:very-short-patch-repair endonuclease
MQRHDPTAALLSAQFGVISRGQALASGMTRRQVEGRVAAGRWRPLLPGVYLSAEASLGWEAWAQGFLLAAGPGAALVGETAAALRELTPRRMPITVAIPPDRRCGLRRDNLRLLRLAVPDPERVTVGGLATTTRLRTAVDVAHLLPEVEAQPLIDRMLVLDLVDLHELTAAVHASTRYGSARARRLVASAHDLAAAESERLTRRLLRAAGLHGWVANHRVEIAGRVIKVDLALPRLRIAIEVKGWTFHSQADRAAADDARVADLQLAGWVVIPVAWLTLHRAPEQFVAQVNSLRSSSLLR